MTDQYIILLERCTAIKMLTCVNFKVLKSVLLLELLFKRMLKPMYIKQIFVAVKRKRVKLTD